MKHVILFFALCVMVASANAQQKPSPAQASATSAQNSGTKTHSGASASEIASAKASHKVWVNLDSGVYHKGGRWFGKTKNGRFMAEDDAKKAGYKAARRD